ncbi:MAG: Gfo/Idh/MocA family oxidoreductase [Trueperaceae bacterium]
MKLPLRILPYFEVRHEPWTVELGAEQPSGGRRLAESEREEFTEMLKVAVVGVSHWHSAMHIPALQLAGAQITAVMDANEVVRERVARESEARPFADLDALLAADRPDLVVAMGRPTEVLALAQSVIQAGIPMVVEKPLGLSAEQVQPLVAESRRQNLFVTMPLVNRYSELWNRLDLLESEGRFGERLHAHFRVVNGSADRYRVMGVEWMLDPSQSGGGPLRNLGIHAFDAFLQFTGGAPAHVRSALFSYAPSSPKIECFASVTVESDSGALATIEAGYSLAAMSGSDTEWRVATTNAYLVDRNNTMRVATLDDGVDETISIPNVRSRYDEFIADVLRRVSDGLPPRISLDDYLQATRLVDAAYAAGRRVHVGA